MLSFSDINLVHVVVAAIAVMVVGAIWYSPMLFAKPWVALIGKRMEDLRSEAGPGYAVATVASLVNAYIFAAVIKVVNAATVYDGIVLGFWIWLGFIATSMAVGNMFEGRRKKLLAINVFNQLVNLLVMGAILAGWK